MIPKKPAPDLIGGGYRFPEKACPRESGGSCPPKNVKRDDDSKISHPVLGLTTKVDKLAIVATLNTRL